MGESDLQEAEGSEPNALRFYCNNNKDCQLAEKALCDANIKFNKIDTEEEGPILITEQRACRSLPEVLSYVAAVSAIKNNYSVRWG